MLTGISWLYGKIIDARNSLYSKNLVRVERLPAPTISVGNISVGGTGKTPLVELIARYLDSRGENVCVISRGYRRDDESKRVLVSDKKNILANPEEAGDEPSELAVRLLGKSFVVSDRDRVGAAKWAYDEFGISVFVLDDAFQHRRAHRDLDIAVVDATNPFGNLKTLPSGTLRERPENLSRADLVILSRTNLCENIGEVIEQVENFAPDVRILASSNQTVGFRRLDDFKSGDTTILKNIAEKAFVFCGLGNPAAFFEQLTQSGIEIVGTKAFQDHHRYVTADTAEITKAAVVADAGILITTAKDAVKLSMSQFALPCYICETELSFENKKGFTDILDKAIKHKNS